MEIIILPKADEDLAYWKQSGNKRIINRISALLADIVKHPFSGIGKPEPLKGTNGKWSRRISRTLKSPSCPFHGYSRYPVHRKQN
ncbi:MAG: Txe/YoeB family addiction module toxin [Bacteroidales bacterium]|nr:Txe/YoeB family addiction module toxin [Bacteroidales bacterium]